MGEGGRSEVADDRIDGGAVGGRALSISVNVGEGSIDSTSSTMEEQHGGLNLPRSRYSTIRTSQKKSRKVRRSRRLVLSLPLHPALGPQHSIFKRTLRGNEFLGIWVMHGDFLRPCRRRCLKKASSLKRSQELLHHSGKVRRVGRRDVVLLELRLNGHLEG